VEEFAKQGVEAERFPATWGKMMSQEELLQNATWGGRYFSTPGMIGCFMSHLRIWRRIAEEGQPAVVVLEDDVVLFPNFDEKLKAVLSELPSDWDVCLIGAVGCVDPDKEAFYMKLYELISGGGRPSPGKTRSISPNIFVPFRPAGTHAYVISQKGAQTLRRLCPKARYHVDLTAWSLPELKLYCVKDQLATQRFGDDTTVSKGGEPATERFLRWVWDVTGFSHMGRKAGVPNLTWAWKTACFAIPFGKRKVIVEMGPSSTLGLLMLMACIPLRSCLPAGFFFAYFGTIVFTIRWLAGTLKLGPVASIAALSALCFYFS